MKLRKTPPTRGLVAVVWHALFGFFISLFTERIIRNRAARVFLVADSQGFRWTDDQGNKGAILPSPILEIPILPQYLPKSPQTPK